MDSRRGAENIIAAIRAGDKAACDDFISRNLRIAQFVVQLYAALARINGISRDDLTQEAAIGIMCAADTYDPDKGAKCSKYTVRCAGKRYTTSSTGI